MSLFNTGIRPSVDDFLLAKAAEKRDYGDYWSASSAGYCMRKLIFERLGVPHVSKEDDARKQRVFTSGHIFHEWVQGITKEAGLSIASEVELKDEELKIIGHFDDLVLIREDTPFGVENIGLTSHHHSEDMPEPKEHLILYDYKTVNSQAFKYKTDKMSHYHKMQLGTYMYMLRRLAITDKEAENHDTAGMIEAGIQNLTEARILNISKDDLRMMEQQLLWSEQLEKDVVGYWRTLNGYWEKQMIPKCTCADFEKNSKTGIGFMADPRYNPYYYENEPCNIKLYEQFKEATSETV